MKRGIRMIAYQGISSGMPELLARRILITNLGCVALASALALYAILLHCLGAHPLGWSMLPIAMASLGLIALNRRGAYRASRLGLIALLNMAALLFSAAGQVSNARFPIFALSCLPFVLFGRKERTSITAGISIALGLWLISLVNPLPWPLSEPNQLYLAVIPSKLLVAGLFSGILYFSYLMEKAEGARREAHERFHQLTGNIQEVFWISDLNKSQMIYISPGYEKVWGRNCQSLYDSPRSFLDAIHPEDRDRIDSALSEQNRDGYYNQDYRITRPDGQIRWIHDRSFPVRDEQGRMYRICGIATDITERRTMESALLESTELFRQMAESIDEIFWIGSVDGRVIHYVNPAFQKVWGFSSQELYQNPQKWAQAIHHEDLPNVSKIFANLGRNSRSDVRFRIVRPTGEVRWLWNRWFPIHGENGAIERICGTASDITAQKESEARLAEQQARMVNASKLSALGQVAGEIAHEINTPLATLITLSSQVLELAAEPTPELPAIAEAASTIERTTQRISKIIKSLRAFSRDGGQDPVMAYPIRQLIEETLFLCWEKLTQHGIYFQLEPVDPELKLECRPIEISQVILNLLNNAYDAVIDRPSPEKWIRLQISEKDDNLEISVTDSGTGLSPEIRNRLFQPFFTTKAQEKGTGLGLGISRSIVHNYRGELFLDPLSPNTRFVIRIPRQQSPTMDSRRSVARPERSPDPQGDSEFIHKIGSPLGGALVVLELILEGLAENKMIQAKEIEQIQQVHQMLERIKAAIQERRDEIRGLSHDVA